MVQNLLVITEVMASGPKCQFEHAHMLAYKKLLDGGVCGMKPIWNGKELVFIIDHIDGHASNNRRDNLLCPNCDSQLDTYKNKCGERSYYRYHKNEINNNKN